MIKEGCKNNEDREKNFKMSIDKITMKFLNSNIEEEFLNYKYVKKNLLIAIGICIYFNNLIYSLRIFQNFFNLYFEHPLTGSLLTQFIIYATITIAVLFIELGIFFISKLQILRGFLLIITSMISVIGGSMNFSKEFSTSVPMFTIITGYIISTNLVCCFLYAWNWICGSIQILMIIGSIDYYVISFDWSWFSDKSFLLLISLSTAFCLILSIYYIEYFQRKSIYMRIEADNQAKNISNIVQKLPSPVVIAKNTEVISSNEAFEQNSNWITLC